MFRHPLLTRHRKSNSHQQLGTAVSQLSRLLVTTAHARSSQDQIFLQKFTPRSVTGTRAASRTSTTTVFHPSDASLFRWLCVVMCAVIYSLWLAPPRIAYTHLNVYYHWHLLGADLLVDIIFAIDICVRMHTGHLEHGIVVSDVRLLRRAYLWSSGALVDAIALLPVDYLVVPIDSRYRAIWRANRWLKIARIWDVQRMIETRTSWPDAVRVLALIHTLLLTSHWFACAHQLIAQLPTNRINERWFGAAAHHNNSSTFSTYLLSLHWSIGTLTTIGNQSSPLTNVEYLFTIVTYLVSVFYFATIVGQVGSVILNRNATRLEYERRLGDSKQYMRAHRVPIDLQRRVERWFEYTWSRYIGNVYFSGRATHESSAHALSVLPDKLRAELALVVNLDMLKKVSIFKECEAEFLHDLVLKMHPIVYTPGDIVCRRGEIAREMYIIAEGLLQVLDEYGQCLRVMKAGDFFGEIGVLNLHDGAHRRTAEVQSMGYSELFMLTRADVLLAVSDYPQARQIISDYGRQRLAHSRQSSPTGTPAPTPTINRHSNNDLIISAMVPRRQNDDHYLSLGGDDLVKNCCRLSACQHQQRIVDECNLIRVELAGIRALIAKKASIDRR